MHNLCFTLLPLLTHCAGRGRRGSIFTPLFKNHHVTTKQMSRNMIFKFCSVNVVKKKKYVLQAFRKKIYHIYFFCMIPILQKKEEIFFRINIFNLICDKKLFSMNLKHKNIEFLNGKGIWKSNNYF